MAINDAAVLKPNTAHFYTAVEGTALPADLRAPGAPWTHLGHTSLEDILSATSEGGETSVLSSLQNRSLRTTTTARSESFQVNLLQLDEDSIKLYFGANTVVSDDGRVAAIPSEPEASKVAFLAVMYDGVRNAGYYAAKAEVIRGEDITISDTESLTQLPIRITPLAVEGSASPYSFILPHSAPAGA